MSSSEEDEAVIDILLDIIKIQVNDLQKRRKKRRMWVRKWISRRSQLGASGTLLRELRTEDPASYFNFLRIDEDMFRWLLERVTPRIQKQFTVLRDPIPAETKLHVVLRLLATGDSLASLEYYFRLPRCTISRFIPETLDALYETCKEYIQIPKSEAEWQKIVEGFWNKWNFPSCVGAIDGKHVVITCPPQSGSNYFNYKGTFSIVLLAVVDDDYNFLCVDIGAYGSLSDGNIFNNSKFKYAIENNKLHLPPETVFLGDEGFPLKTYLMKPFFRRVPLTDADKIFNYRLSRARRIVENAFGILSSRFRIFHRPINLHPNTVPKLVRTTCSLHNWIRKTSKSLIGTSISVDIEDTEFGNIILGSWRSNPTSDGIRNLGPADQRNPTQLAKDKRLQLRDFFIGEGAVSWQQRMIE